MNTKLEKDVTTLNRLSLVRYLDILDIKPIDHHPGCLEYETLLYDHPMTIIVDYIRNRFFDKFHNREGGLVDFACLLFECTTSELCDNIVPYGIDRLMSESRQPEAARP
jgi:hypothetical protein